MGRYILFRAAASVPVLIGITIIVFVILSLIPGDPATAILGSYATPENVARLNAQLGLDRPLVQRYFIWLGNLLQGDLGRSFSLNRPVIDEILERFNATLILSGLAFVMCSVLGILAGVISATRQYGLADKLITFSVLVGISVPSFFLGMMMILYFAVNLRWLPASGMYALYGGGDLPDLLHHLVMPAIALALANDPDIIIADEPTTALDVTVQAQVLRILDDLRRQKGVGLIFISHDLNVVSQISDRIAVMYAGQIVECGPSRDVLEKPAHPYTRALLASSPQIGAGGELPKPIDGGLPRPDDLPAGCAFAARCEMATDICSASAVEMRGSVSREVRCVKWEAANG